MPRPWMAADYEFRGVAQLSECGVTGNVLSCVLAAPEAEEEIFVLGLAYKAGHSGEAGRLEIQDIDGLVVWAEGLGTTDTWVGKEFTYPGIRIPTKQGKVVLTNTELSVAEIWVRTQTK